jgi:hypothetical protein
MAEVLTPAVPGYDGWLSEFEAFQQAAQQAAPSSSVPRAIAATTGSASVMSKSTRQPKPERSAAEELEAEMKLLHWHKLANEAALKAALLKTKKAKSSKGAGGILRAAPPAAANHMPLEEKAVWVQQIIEEEQSKPLQVGRDFIEEYERHEKTQGARLDREIERHIASLKRLREQVTVREAMRSRRAEFRTVQQQLEREKHALLQGRLAGASAADTAAETQQQQDAGAAAAAVSVSGALNTVLGSLSKLMELEKRISNLESSNAYDEQYPAAGGSSNNQNASQAASITNSSSAGAAGAARLSFTKRRTEASLTQPSKEYYAVQQHRHRQQQQSSTRSSYNSGLRSAATTGRRLQRPAQNRRVTGAASVRSGSRTVGARSVYQQQQQQQQQQQRRGSGTFMTSVPEARRTHSSAIVEKRRVEARRKAAREQAESVRITRQDKIISEWVQQRRARASTNSSSSGAAAMPAAGRAKRARTGNNPHLEQFRDIRAEYTKRKEALLRGMSSGNAAARGTRTTSNTTSAAAKVPVSNRYGSSSTTRGGGLGAARTLRASGTLNSSAQLSKTATSSNNRHSSSSSSAVVTAQRGGLQSGPLSIGGAGFTVSNSQFVRGKAPQALPSAAHNRAAAVARQQPLSKVQHGAGTGVKGARAARARRQA